MNEKQYLVAGGKEGFIEEWGGRRWFCLTFRQGRIPDFHKKIIGENLCDSLLPMVLIESAEALRISYDFTGFIKLSEALPRWKTEGLPVSRKASLAIAAAIRSLILAENFLLDGDYFPLLPDTVFTGIRTDQARLIYFPESSAFPPIQEQVRELIRSTGVLAGDDEWIAYGEEIRQIICSENLSLMETVFLLEEKAGEMERKQWPAKVMVRDPLQEAAESCGKTVSEQEKRYFFRVRK